jgi:hypothetical protein
LKRRFPVPATKYHGKPDGLRQAWPQATAQRREAGFTKTVRLATLEQTRALDTKHSIFFFRKRRLFFSEEKTH